MKTVLTFILCVVACSCYNKFNMKYDDFYIVKNNHLQATSTNQLETFPKGVYIMPVSPDSKIIKTKINDTLTIKDDIVISWFKINKQVDADDIKNNKIKTQKSDNRSEEDVDVLEISYFIFLDDQRVFYYSSHGTPAFKNNFRATKHRSVKNYKRGYYYLKDSAIKIELETDRGESIQLTGNLKADTLSFNTVFVKPEIKSLYDRPIIKDLDNIIETKLQFYFIPATGIELELGRKEKIDSINFNKEKALRTYFITDKNNIKKEKHENLNQRDSILTW